jgi:outer membrane autotransporter protein
MSLIARQNSATTSRNRKTILLTCAATIALASPALAGTYSATDDASLRTAIATANGDGAASSTITLANDVIMTSMALPVATKDLTIDSGSFTFLKTYAAGTATQGVVSFSGAATGIVTLKGNVTGVSGPGTGQYALVLTGGTNVVNDAIITGGNGSSLAGLGASVTSSTLTNNGTITGGNGGGGHGAQLFAGATLINTGTLQAGNGTSLGATGVTTSTSASTITNSGTIRGGTGTTGNGGNAIQANFATQVTNSGTITGGGGAVTGGNGITLVGAGGVNALLNNSGTITAGNGTTGTGGIGVSMSSGASLTNSNGATILGGNGATGGVGVNATGLASQTTVINNSGTITGGGSSTGSGAYGVSLGNYTVLTNDGTIIGADGQTGAGSGVNGAGTVGPVSIINHGIIRGGNNATGIGGYGMFVRGTTQPIINSGTVQGGNAAAGIAASTNFSLILTNSGTVQGGASAAAILGSVSPNTAITITNSGTLAAGIGYANAIETQNATTIINLELDKGYAVTGNVVGNTGVINTLTLGGDGNASFDVSAVGPQYQNFTVFNKTGNSVWTLTGTATVSTPWLISAGTLQIGDGTATGSILGDVTDNATLAFNRSDSVTFANVITGTGGVNQIGSGTTILTATNTYSGATTVSAGTLQVNGSIVSPTVTVAAGTLAVGGTATASTIAVQSGGTLSVSGSIASPVVTVATGGTLLVNGSIAGSSAIGVGGLMKVNGSASTSTVTVQSGGTLGGNGTVGATTILSGGTIAPGNSIGTLHVNGAFAQNAGSIYQVEVDPTSNASDLILVNGTATIQSGATLNVTKNPQGAYRQGAQYTVLTASGGVTGSYALTSDTALSQYLALRESQDADNIYLSIVQTGDPATAAVTPNQTAVAQAVDSQPPTSSVPSAILNSPSAAAVPPAFDALSGEALASAKGVLISSSLLVRDTTLDRLRDVFCSNGSQDNQVRHAGCVADRPSVWAQGFGDWGHVYGTANAAGVSQTTRGFLTGVDVPVYDWRIGVFGGYSRTDFDVGARASSGASNSYHLGLYGGTLLGDFKLSLGASYSWNGIDTERLVAFNNFSNDLRARYNAGTTQVFGEIGNSFQAGGVSLEPFASLAYVGMNTDGFSEVGGDAALTSKRDTSQDMFATLGVRPSTQFALGGVSAVLRGMVGWRHTFGDIIPTSLVSFAGSKDFAVAGAPIAKNAGVVEVGLGADVSSHAAIGVTYGGQFSDRQTDHSIRGTITLAF